MKRLTLASLILLAGCSTSGPAGDYRPYLANKGVQNIAPDSIPHCHGYGCRLKSYATLTPAEWKQIGKYFKTGRTALEERQAISQAVGEFERIIGPKTGTASDIAGTYEQLGDEQQDCADESVNTTVYLELLRQKNLLKHHDVSNIAARIPILGGGLGFHQTAVIVERETGARYAVDSWFYDNGHNADIVPLSDWLYGWRPNG